MILRAAPEESNYKITKNHEKPHIQLIFFLTYIVLHKSAI